MITLNQILQLNIFLEPFIEVRLYDGLYHWQLYFKQLNQFVFKCKKYSV